MKKCNLRIQHKIYDENICCSDVLMKTAVLLIIRQLYTFFYLYEYINDKLILLSIIYFFIERKQTAVLLIKQLDTGEPFLVCVYSRNCYHTYSTLLPAFNISNMVDIEKLIPLLFDLLPCNI